MHPQHPRHSSAGPIGKKGPICFAALAFLIASALLIAISTIYSSEILLDLRVYRDAIAAWGFGQGEQDLYTLRVTKVDLPFTYPPFSTLILAPLSAIPLPFAAALITAAGIACVAITIFASFRGLGVTPPATLLIATALLFATPVRETFMFGQVNLLLMGLVAVDLFLMTRSRMHGALVGIAASVKLTPAIFLLLPAARKRWKALAVGGATIVACLALSTLLLPTETTEYFTSIIFDPTRPGGPDYVSNQAVSGTLARLGVASPFLWVLLAGACVVLSVVVAARAPHPSVAVLAVALGGLLASPISWSHHWAWVCVAPAAALALRRSGFRFASGVTFAFLAAVCLWNPVFLEFAGWPENRAVWAVAVSNIYTAVGVMWLGALAFALVRTRARPEGAIYALTGDERGVSDSSRDRESLSPAGCD